MDNDFTEHLRRASNKVSGWPEWKRGVLGGKIAVTPEQANRLMETLYRSKIADEARELMRSQDDKWNQEFADHIVLLAADPENIYLQVIGRLAQIGLCEAVDILD